MRIGASVRTMLSARSGPSLPSSPVFERKEERLIVRSRHFGAVTLSVRRMGQGPPLVCVHAYAPDAFLDAVLAFLR